MGTSELLRYLEKLEIGLSNFSYEELSTSEAGELKKSFNQFKNGLEDKVFGTHPMNDLEVFFEEVGISGAAQKKQPSAEKNTAIQEILKLLLQLEATPLNATQNSILKKLKTHTSFLEGQNGQPSGENLNQIEKRLEVQRKSKVDIASLWEECIQQMDLLEELIRLYRQNVVEFVGKIRVHLQNKNFRGIDFACEKLGSSLRMLKTLSLLEITEQMSLVCKTDNDLKHLKFLYGQFLVEFPKVEELLDLELEMLKKRNR